MLVRDYILGFKILLLFQFCDAKCTNSKFPFDETNFDIGISYGR
jgi:hypothetical protein